MKKKTGIIVAVVVLIIACLCFFVFSKSPEEKINERVLSYAEDYKVVQEKEDIYEISVMAPDFIDVMDDLESEEADNPKALWKSLKNHEEADKEYRFYVKKENQELINEKYMDEVKRVLMVEAISRMPKINK